MVDGLLINGQDAFDTYGAIMGDDFLNQLDAPAPLKDFITFDSRTANGTEYLIKDTSGNPYARVKARDLTLKFRLFGVDTVIENNVVREATIAEQAASLQSRKKTLLSVLQSGLLAINIPDLNTDTYYLLYTGQSVSYDLNADRTSCLIGAKFVEPNPIERFPFVKCTTAAATSAKTGTSYGAAVALTGGQKIRVLFTNSNSAETPTLQVNSLDAKSIQNKNGTWSAADNWIAGSLIDLTYNGTAWRMS